MPWEKGIHGEGYGPSRWGGAKGAAMDRKPRQIGGPGRGHIVNPEVKAQRRKDADEAWGVRMEILRDPTAPTMARLHAADSVADRVEGKPAQTVNVRRITCLADLTDDELAALEADAEAKRER